MSTSLSRTCLRLAAVLALGSLPPVAGCAAPVDGQDGVASAGALADSAPVALMHAKADTRCDGPGGPCFATASGLVEVENLAFAKEVVVRVNDGTGWTDVPATYVGPTAGNREAWEFETPPRQYSPRLGVTYRLAIRYRVGGREYWDNRGGADYRVSTGPRPAFPSGPDTVLGRSVVVLEQAYASPRDGGASIGGRILLRDIAYEKEVGFVYTGDDWKTVHVARARHRGYANPAPAEGAEYWEFGAELPEPTNRIELAVFYTVQGTTHWDDNVHRNHVVGVPGRLE